MKNKFAVLAFTAVVLSAVSCGNDAPEESSVTLDLPAITTEAAKDTEAAEEINTTVQTTVKTTVITEISSAESEEVTTETVTEAVTEKVTEPPEEQAAEPPADEVPVTEPPATEPPVTEPPAPEPPVIDTVKFSINDLSGNALDIVNALGEPLDVLDAAGCLSNGADQRIYTYDGLQISCYIHDDAPYIYQIMITNSNYSTSENITVGSSRSDVESAYGMGEGSDFVIYADGGKELDIQYDGDTVSSIYIYMAV